MSNKFTNAVCSAPTHGTKAQGEIDQQMDRLAIVVGQLVDAASNLSDRLEPVLRTQPAKLAPSPCDEGAETPLGSQIRELRQTAAGVRETLRDLVERLEV